MVFLVLTLASPAHADEPTESSTVVSQPLDVQILSTSQIDGQTATVLPDTSSTLAPEATPVAVDQTLPDSQTQTPIVDSSQPSDPSPVAEPAPSTETIVDPQITEQPLPAPADTTVSTTLDTPIQIQTTVEQTPLAMSSPAPVVVETVTPGGDDSSYRIPITVPVLFNGVEYTNIYATTNSVIAFGREDGTYWDYPNTPSISIESKDWWVLPQQMPDTHFIIRTSDGGFQVDGVYRPFGSMTGATTQIVITAQILTDGNVSYTYSVDGPLAGNERTGARLQNGTVVTLEQAGVTQVEAPVVLAPESISQEELAAQQAAAEAARIAAEQAAAAEAARIEAERLAAIEAARIAAEAEAARLAAIEAARVAAEQAAAEAARIAAEQAAAEAARLEAARIEAERLAAEALRPTIPAGASTLSEGSSAEITAPAGKIIATINAWYGDPANGSRGIDISAQLTQAFAGATSATLTSSNEFGDPAGGTVKILIFLVTYQDAPAPTPVEPAPSTPEVSPVTPPPSESQGGQTPVPTPDPTPPAPESSQSGDPQTPPPSTNPPSGEPSQPQEPTPSQTDPYPSTPPNPVEPPPPAPEVEPEPLPEPEQPPVEPEEPSPTPEDPSTEPPIEEPLPPTEEQPPLEEPEAPPVEAEEPPAEEAPPVEEEPQPELPETEPESPLEESSSETTILEEAVNSAVDDAQADGVVTEAEKEVIADALIEAAQGGAVSAADIAAAGIEYKDLPPETPVEVRQDENGNEVIITADVAAALVLLENPSELIGAIFSDPGQALLALGSIGADMSPEEREEATEMVVAAVVAAGAAINAVGAATGSTGGSSSGNTGGGSSGGGGASGDLRGIRRRKP